MRTGTSRRLRPLTRRTARCISLATRLDLLRQLARNAELHEDDAKAELRWMIQADRPAELGSMVERRARGEPLQYILGSTDFGSLELKCRAPTLIPRPETAEIFGRLAHLLSSRGPQHREGNVTRPLSIVDLCTGSACIPLLLKHHLGNQVRLYGYDFSSDAIKLARENITETSLGVQVRQVDIFDQHFASTVLQDMGERVDIVVSNPPYITANEYRDLPSSVKDYEDPAALLGEKQGLAFYQRIASLLPDLLTDQADLERAGWTGLPRVAVEIGSKQAGDVEAIFRSAGMHRAETWDDQYGQPRMVLAWDH